MGQGKSKLSLDEQMKLNQRAIKKSIRELEREKNTLARQEQKLINDIREMAKKGQMSTVKIMAKDLVRTRKYSSKFIEMKAQLQGVSLQLQTMKSTEAMTRAMKGVSQVMCRMNQQIDTPAITKIMQEFMTETQKMEMTEELVGEALDQAFSEDEDETDMVVNQVLDEIGIEMNQTMSTGPTGQIQGTAQQAAPQAEASVEEDDLEARLNALKR